MPDAQGMSAVPHPQVGSNPLASANDTVRKGLGERIFVVCVLTLSTTAFVTLLPGESGVEFEEQGKFAAQILWIVLYLVMLIFVRKRVGELLRLMWQNKPLVLLLGWACLSVVWSIDRTVTIRHSIALLLCSFFAVYFSVRYSLREQLQLVLTALGLGIVSSVGACLLFPKYGIQADSAFDEPSWQGVFSGKNMLARFAMLAAVILLLYLLRGVRRAVALVGIVLVFFLILQTHAITTLVYFLAGVLAFPFVRAFVKHPAKRNKIVAIALLMFVGVAAWTYYNWENFTYSLGKDPGLTGRVALWALSMTWIGDKPLVGHGFDAFWSDFYGPASDLRAASGWLVAPHAHNGFINLWLDLGATGVLIFTLGAAVTYRRAVEVARTSKSLEGIWPVSFLTFFLLYSLTETSFLSRNDLLWILYVAAALALQRLSEKKVVSGYELIEGKNNRYG